MATSSVARGAFLFPSQNRRSILSGCMEPLPMENDKLAERRKGAFTQCWEAMKSEIDDIITSQHNKVLDRLLLFISKSHTQLLSAAASRPSDGVQVKFQPPRLEVSSGVLISGVNMSDHDTLFEELHAKLLATITPHVVLLKARRCNSGMRATMKEILGQLMKTNPEISNDSDDEEEADSQLQSLSTGKLPLCSMSVLCSWYQESCKTPNKQGTSQSTRAVDGSGPPVVIIIEDFEAFVPHILQDLILSLSPHLSEFPAMLVFGVATSVSVVHQILSQRATSVLSMEQFHTQPSTDTLAQIISRVLLTTQFPFKLGPRALDFLHHQFSCYNFSLTGFTRGLQCALMEHFHWQPLSWLCSSSLLVETKQWTGMNHGFCEAVRATPSFQRYLSSLDPQERLNLLQHDSKLKVKVKELSLAWNSYHATFYPLLRCLHHFTNNLPNAPLGAKLHELYLLGLQQDIVEQSKFKSAWTVVNLMSRDEFCGKVSRSVEELREALANSSSSSTASSSQQVLKDTLNILDRFSEEVTRLDSGAAMIPESEDLPTSSRAETTSERKMIFQERLRKIASRSSNTRPSAFDNLRTKVTSSLLATFTKHLQAPASLPLHEVFYFDQLSSLQRQLGPAPRVTIQQSLKNPSHYLKTAREGGGDDEALSSKMPDICITYQLHLECGRLINLYDWLQSYVTVVQPDAAGADDDDEDGTVESVDPVLHAQFTQAVSELQFLGFIKPTYRKTDHVQRQTWGPLF